MALTNPPPALRRRRTEPLLAPAFVLLVCLAAAAVDVAVVATVHPLLGRLSPLWLVLVAVTVLGELRPVLLGRNGNTSDEVTVSSAFSVSLLLTAPLAVAIVAQSAAVIVDDVRQRKDVRKIAFNVAQYTLSLAAARAVFAAATGRALFGEVPVFTADELLAGLLAAATFFVVNNTLISTVIGLSSGQRVLPLLVDDARYQLGTSGVLLAFAPALAAAVDYAPVLLPLLLLPIAAIHRAARLAQQREHQALHDALTGLPNRQLLRERLEEELERRSAAEQSVAVLLIDLDHFKEINDTLGHQVGDELIRAVGERLASGLRDHDTIARLGGDEFAVIVPTTGSSAGAEAERVAKRLCGLLESPFTLDGVRLDVQASVGIALSPEHGTAVDTLVQRADIALYGAKERRGGYLLYAPDNDRHNRQRLSMLGELRRGIDEGELVLHYQPKSDARSGTVVGVEALVRWAHPVRGLLAPDEFVPLAENTGLIGPLTLHVLDVGLQQLRMWHDVGHRLSLSVNLSVRQLTDLNLPVQVAELLARRGVPASALTLEVTESTIMADPTRAATVLGQLRAMGVTLAVDDFGTGYSSLSYLKRLDVDEIKIDKSFVLNMARDDNDAVIVRSTIELGHNLGLRVVAEGVEDLEILHRLVPLGCDVVQGYHISPPLPSAAMTSWLDPQPPLVVVSDGSAA